MRVPDAEMLFALILLLAIPLILALSIAGMLT